MANYLRPRRGRGSTMQSKNPILKKGEVFFEMPEAGCGKGIGKLKVGDGITPYNSLPYFLEQKIYLFDESTSGVTVSFDYDHNKTQSMDLDQCFNTYWSKIVTGAKLGTIICAIKYLLYELKVYSKSHESIIKSNSHTVSVGTTAPAAGTPYLLWVDTSNENNFLKFRSNVNSDTWTQVSSVWN